MNSAAPPSTDQASPPAQEGAETISAAERELYGGRLRYDQSFVRHEGPLTRLGFGHMAAALPRMVAMVLRTGWQTDPRALAGVVAAQLGQGVAAGWGLVAVNSVLSQLFANGPTGDKLRQSLPSLSVLAVTAVATALLMAWSTAMSGRLEPQVERVVSSRYYRAVTDVEVEATERPEVQRVLEAGRFGTDSARTMLRLSVGVGNVVIGMVAAAVVLVSLHWALLPMLLAIALPRGWGAVRSARREYLSRLHWVDHRRAIASLLAYLTRPHAAGELRVHDVLTELTQSFMQVRWGSASFPAMPDEGRPGRGMRNFVLPEIGKLRETGDPWEPYQLLDPFGKPVEPVAVYFKDLMAGPYSPLTPRSYGMDLLRWWRFLWVFGIEWDRAIREDARDFTLWMKLADKPVRVHWRHRGKDSSQIPPPRADRPTPGTPNPVTGKPTVGRKYALTTRAHFETVLRTFYDWHLDMNSGALLVNPFPLDRSRHRGQRRPNGSSEQGDPDERTNAHHNPMEEFKAERKGRYRPTVPKRIPRRIPEDKYTEVFAGLRSHRDRALLAFWVSNGARAEELLSPKQGDAKVGQQTIGVIRKGTGEYQELPANIDAFVWLRLYQEEAWKKGVPRGRSKPLWWTLRRPWRPLEYDAARMMFNRANALLGANWTLHDLRHTATFLMLDDPNMPPVYVQHILGHKYLSTLDIYNRPTRDDVITAGLAHYARQERKRNEPLPAPPAPAYNRESLNVLFGGPFA